jgi:hypothetical protein
MTGHQVANCDQIFHLVTRYLPKVALVVIEKTKYNDKSKALKYLKYLILRLQVICLGIKQLKNKEN